MIIKSQKSDTIVNFDKVDFICIDNDLKEEGLFAICAHCPNSDFVELGIYENEKGAKKVIERIYAAAVIGERYLNLSEDDEKEML
ncbi:MAG: hypothetical protein J6C46_11505 [Clostridia bacterium]|nr:hypothetical protein [Clostridia bacterium]